MVNAHDQKEDLDASEMLNPLDSKNNSSDQRPIDQTEDTLEDDIQRDWSAQVAQSRPIGEADVTRKWFANGYSFDLQQKTDISMIQCPVWQDAAVKILSTPFYLRPDFAGFSLGQIHDHVT